jgi:hypothetical protein
MLCDLLLKDLKWISLKLSVTGVSSVERVRWSTRNLIEQTPDLAFGFCRGSSESKIPR